MFYIYRCVTFLRLFQWYYGINRKIVSTDIICIDFKFLHSFHGNNTVLVYRLRDQADSL